MIIDHLIHILQFILKCCYYSWHQGWGTKLFFCFFLLSYSGKHENNESMFFDIHKNVNFRLLLWQLYQFQVECFPNGKWFLERNPFLFPPYFFGVFLLRFATRYFVMIDNECVYLKSELKVQRRHLRVLSSG